MSSERLSWRIPTTGDPRLLKLSLAQVGLATIVAALILLVAAPRPWLGPALAGLVPLAVFMAYRRWRRFQRSLIGPENIWLDDAGLHWIDAAQQKQSFSREDIVGFRVGHEADTLRAIPALTVYLGGGFESQPIELYPPATEPAVREILQSVWQLPEQSFVSNGPPSAYDLALNVYSECHDDTHEWHWEGSRDDLAQLFAQFRRAAEELALPPPGAKPQQRVIRLQRRLPAKLNVAHASAANFDHDIIAGPREVLCQISDQAAEALAKREIARDAKFDVRLGANSGWTFHLHVLS